MTEAADQRFAPPTAHVEDIVTAGEELGGRGMRFLAAFIDGVIYIVLAMGLARIPGLETLFGQRAGSDVWTTFHITGFLTPLILQLGVNGWLLVNKGQTIGKMICKLRIVRSDGSKANAWHVLGLRYGVGYVVNVLAILSSIYGLIDSLLIFRESRKCLHDNIADTKVIKL
ncbi:RDD family protein [Burkholderiaceae bacterium UC74_6]